MSTTFQDEVFKQRLFKREIWINGYINDELIERLVINLLALDETEGDRKEPRPIKVYINSPGGHLYEALAAVDVMLSLNSPVETIVLGSAMSGGLILLMGGQTRKAYERSSLLFHTARSHSWGVLPDAESRIHHTKYLMELTAELFGSRTRQPKEFWTELLDGGRDKYFTSRAALEVGILTEIIPRSARERENGPAELPAPEDKPLLAEPKHETILEIAAAREVEILPAEERAISQTKAGNSEKPKKRKK